MFNKVRNAFAKLFGNEQAPVPVPNNHIGELVVDIPLFTPPPLPYVSNEEFTAIRRLNTPQTVAKMLAKVAGQNRANKTHVNWTTWDYDSLEMYLKTLTILTDIALIKLAGDRVTLDGNEDTIVCQYAVLDGKVYDKVKSFVAKLNIKSRLELKGEIASSGSHRYLFITFSVKGNK